MRPITNVKSDASFTVVLQKFDSVEDLTLRISATRSRHEVTVKVSWTVCALLKLVNSGAEVALSRRRVIRFLRFQSVFLVHSSIVMTVVSESTVTDKTATAVLAQGSSQCVIKNTSFSKKVNFNGRDRHTQTDTELLNVSISLLRLHLE